MKKLASFLILAFLIMFVVLNVNAQPLETRVLESDLVIEGKVLSQQGFHINEKRNIVTCNIIEVFKVFKGEAVQDTICLITSGGFVIVGDLYHSESSSNRIGLIFESTDGIFFLKENEYYKLNEEDAPKGLKQYTIQSITIKLAFGDDYIALEEGRFINNYQDIYYKNFRDLYGQLEEASGKPMDKRKENRIELKRKE